MQGDVGLEDDVLPGLLFELVHQLGLVRLQGLDDLRVGADGELGGVDGVRHLARLVLDLVTKRGDGLDHADAVAGRTGLAEQPLERQPAALAGDGDEAELVEAQHFRGRAVDSQRVLERGHHPVAVAAVLHVDEVDDDDAAEVAQPDLAHDLLDGVQVGLDDGVFQARGALAHVLAGVDVDGHQRLGVVDDDVAARLQPDLGLQGPVDLPLHAHLVEDGGVLGVELDAVGERGLEVRHELDHLGVLFFVVDPDALVLLGEMVAQQALHQAQVMVEQGGRGALLRPHPDVVPELDQVVDVLPQVLVRAAAGGGADDEAAADGALELEQHSPQARPLLGGADLARDPHVLDGGHEHQVAPRQGDVRGDARALLAHLFLGDLHDDFLPGPQQLRDGGLAPRRPGVHARSTAGGPGPFFAPGTRGPAAASAARPPEAAPSAATPSAPASPLPFHAAGGAVAHRWGQADLVFLGGALDLGQRGGFGVGLRRFGRRRFALALRHRRAFGFVLRRGLGLREAFAPSGGLGRGFRRCRGAELFVDLRLPDFLVGGSQRQRSVGANRLGHHFPAARFARDRRLGRGPGRAVTVLGE